MPPAASAPAPSKSRFGWSGLKCFFHCFRIYKSNSYNINNPTHRYTDSFGDEIKELSGGRRWRLQGTAKAIWENELKGIIGAILNGNETRIYRGLSEQPNIRIDCCMWGDSKAQARPTVLIFLAEFPRVGEEILKLLKELDVLADRGFKGMTVPGHISLVAAPGLQQQSSTITITKSHGLYTICGSDILVQGQSSRHATLTLPLNIDGKLFLLGPAHIFTAEKTTYRALKGEAGSEGDVCDNEEGFEDNNLDEKERGPRQESSAEMSRQTSSEYAIVACQHPSPSFNISGARVFRIASEKPGRDWVLLEAPNLDNDSLRQTSQTVVIKRKCRNKQVKLGKTEENPPTGEVSIVSRRGVFKGIGSGTTTLVKLGRSDFSSMWVAELKSPLELGDSGSLVINPRTGGIYGMLVATSRVLQEGYIIPMKDILQDIRNSCPSMSVQLPGSPIAFSSSHSSSSSPQPSQDPTSLEACMPPPTEAPQTPEGIRSIDPPPKPNEPDAPPISSSRGTQLVDRAWKKKTTLTLDGRGIRGYGTLLILRLLMEYIRRIEELSQPNSDTPVSSSFHPLKGRRAIFLPCHYFDYIAGTSTAGLNAIMLSRLRMSVDDCIKEYKQLCERVYGYPRILSQRGPIWIPCRTKYDSERLAKAIKDILERRQGSSTASFAANLELCKTAVVVTRKQDRVESPFIFRTCSPSFKSQQISSLRPDQPLHNDIKIWEAGRATCAASTFFKNIKINGETFKEGAVGAATHLNWTSLPQSSKPHEPRERKWAVKLAVRVAILDTGINENPQLKRGQCFAMPSKEFSDFTVWHQHDLKACEPWRCSYKSSSKPCLFKVEHEIRDYLAKPEVRESLEKLAKILVHQRQIRASTDRWESYAVGAKWKCPLCRQRDYTIPGDLRSHLSEQHVMNESTFKDTRLQDLVDKGRYIDDDTNSSHSSDSGSSSACFDGSEVDGKSMYSSSSVASSQEDLGQGCKIHKGEGNLDGPSSHR